MARSLLSSASASVVFPEPGKPHTTINLPGLCTGNYVPARPWEQRAISLRTGEHLVFIEGIR